MKNLLGLAVLMCLGLASGVFALSCASYPSFDEMVAEGEMVLRGTVTSVQYDADDSEAEYCDDMGKSDTMTGEHYFRIAVSEVIAGEYAEKDIELSRVVSGVNCTRGGACADLQVGEEYVIITNSAGELQGGLCSPCPYMLASEYDAPLPEMCICTMEYAPVCGTDGQTYGNACNLDCAGAERAYDGECVEESIIHSEISSTCTSRYDGCNTCTVVDGLPSACTKMACFVQGEAYCQAHDFVILKKNHLNVIDQVLMAWETSMKSSSPDVYLQKKERILKKIANKRADIKSLLARSTFVIDSPELRKYSFALEVLDAVEVKLR